MSTGIDIDVDLTASLGRLADKLDRDYDDRRREREIQRARVPTFVRLQNSGIIPTPTVPFGLAFGGPDAGFEWVVRRIVVGGLKWSTTAAGSAEVYVTGLGTTTGSASSGGIAALTPLSDLVDQSASLPNKAFYGRDELVVKENESLVVVINTGTAAQQYVASVFAMVRRTVTGVASLIEGV